MKKIISILLVLITCISLVACSKTTSKPKTKGFNELFPLLNGSAWCTIASDGSYMKIDTDPYDQSDISDVKLSEMDKRDYPDVEIIKHINSELGFTEALYEKMCSTAWDHGKQTDSNDEYAVSWTYHPDKGLEIMYEVKN